MNAVNAEAARPQRRFFQADAGCGRSGSAAELKRAFGWSGVVAGTIVSQIRQLASRLLILLGFLEFMQKDER